MEQTNIDKALKVLGNLGAKELGYVGKTLTLAQRRKLPIQRASDFITYIDDKVKVSFKDRQGKAHIGLVKKVNQRLVSVVDTKTNRYFSVAPDTIKVATPDEEARVLTKMVTTTRRRGKVIKKDESGKIIFGRRADDLANNNNTTR